MFERPEQYEELQQSNRKSQGQSEECERGYRDFAGHFETNRENGNQAEEVVFQLGRWHGYRKGDSEWGTQISVAEFGELFIIIIISNIIN